MMFFVFNGLDITTEPSSRLNLLLYPTGGASAPQTAVTGQPLREGHLW